jgi:hypothetical protein
MNLKAIITVCVMMIFPYSIILCQESTANNKNLNKPFLTASQNVPKWVAWGLMWPSAQEMARQTDSTSATARKATENILQKCIKPYWYEPNSVPELISFRDRPDSNYVKVKITQFEKDGYIFHINDTNEILFVGIKRTDGQDIWDMNQPSSTFVPKVIEKFFLDESLGPRPGKEVFYAYNQDGTKGFYACYLPIDEKDFWASYMWTDGKIIVLRVDKLFEENKMKQAGRKEDARW